MLGDQSKAPLFGVSKQISGSLAQVSHGEHVKGSMGPSRVVPTHRSLALHLLEAGWLTLSQASKVAGVSIEEFMELLAETGIPAVDYPLEELADELKSAL